MNYLLLSFSLYRQHKIRKERIIVLITFLVSTIGNAQEWKQISEPINYGAFHSIYFVDSNKGWATNNGVILKTSDGGSTWVEQSSNDGGNYFHFFDKLTGWIVGYSVVKTSDGGESWQKQDFTTNNRINSVYFVNREIGWMVGDVGSIYKTLDGGSTWLPQSIETYQTLSDVFFINDQVGWVIGNKVYKTTNGGLSWDELNLDTDNWFESIYFIDNSVGWLSGRNGTVFKTENSGESWTKQTADVYNLPRHIYFEDRQIGWAVGNSSNGDFLIYLSTNGGLTWIEQASNLKKTFTYDIYFLDREDWWISGEGGTILRTIDSGINWERQISDAKLDPTNCIHFVDDSIGWAVTDYGNVLNTKDGGKSWIEQSISGENLFTEVFFIDEDIGWVVGFQPYEYGTGVVFKTTNGGLDWFNITPNTVANQEYAWIRSVHFQDYDTGWIVGSNGAIFKTANGGTTWDEQESNTSATLSSVHFQDYDTGWVVGSNGAILKTVNGGMIWGKQESNTVKDFNNVHFISNEIGWAVGKYGKIQKTINGGVTWERQVSETTESLNDVFFLDSMTGWVAGGNDYFPQTSGFILSTQDGGETWEKERLNSSEGISSLHFTNGSKGWAVSHDGLVFEYSGSSDIPDDRDSVSLSGNGYIVQYSLDASTEDIQKFQQDFIDSGAFLVKECVKCGSNPIQVWGSDKPIDIETRRRIAQTRSNIDTLENNFTIEIEPWDISDAQIWKAQESSTTAWLNDVQFIDSLRGWAVGSAGTILKTDDGGNNWEEQTSSTGFELTSVHFLDSLLGWAIGTDMITDYDAGIVLKTTNGGRNWNVVSEITGETHNSLFFLDSLNGWMGGDYGILFRTTNGGSDWEEFENYNARNGIYFINSYVGWAVGGGTILKTTNGGDSWINQMQIADSRRSFQDIFFVNDQVGWVVGENGIVLHTRNGGDTWDPQVSGTEYTLNSVSFVDSLTGWAAGDFGVILRTSNGGKNWSLQPTGTDERLWSVYFEDNKSGWVVGDRGTILSSNQQIDSTQIYTPVDTIGKVRVAVVDTGAKLDHYLLQNALWVNSETFDFGKDSLNCISGDFYGYNFLFGEGDVSDVDGHGTSVSGAIVRNFPDSVGLELMSLKFYDEGYGNIFDAVCAIYYAISEGANIINLSWGFESPTPPGILYDALTVARDSNILVVTSAGNTAQNNDVIGKYPANLDLDNIIVVTADSNQYLASYSSYGKENVDIAASGSVQTTSFQGGVSAASGTSLAAPIVTRTAAVIMGLYPELTYQEVRDCIFSTVDALYAPEGKGVKYGVLNHDAAVACAANKGIDLGIEQFQLIEEPSGNLHQVIQDGDTLDRSLLPAQMNILVETPNTQGSLELSLQGPQSISLVRNSKPYTLFDSPVAALEEGKYRLEGQRYALTDTMGRTEAPTEVSFIVVDQTITEVRDDIKQDLVQIYPNPATDELVVNWGQGKRKAVALSLYNMQGRVVKQYLTQMGEGQATLNLSQLPKGIYLLKLQTNEQTLTEKIIRE